MHKNVRWSLATSFFIRNAQRLLRKGHKKKAGLDWSSLRPDYVLT
jgi:hypothetical protein